MEVGRDPRKGNMNRPCQISTTTLEEQIFEFLMEVHAQRGLSGHVRVAGGWVRDKLLGHESDDMDISLDGITGEQFGKVLLDHVASYEHKNGGPHPAGHMKSYMTKNELRTTGVKIFGQKVEFAHLRSETYGDGSRKPEVRPGTAEQDALRRDLTINSMFFNINTRQVEDWTLKGREDLSSMTLRTPLEPKKTFTDDPLRVLRTLRFRSRFQGAILRPEIVEAMADQDVQKAYSAKVSPERAGPELIKLLGGREPAQALRPLFETRFDKVVFNVPETRGLEDLWMDQNVPEHHRFSLIEHTLRVVEHMNRISMDEGVDDETRVRLNMAALFHDFGKAWPGIRQPKKSDPSHSTYIGHEEKSSAIADAVLKKIAVGEDDRKFVCKVIELHMKPHTHQGPKNKKWSKRMMGKFLREATIEGQDTKGLWRLIWLHAIADELAKGTGDEAAGVALKREGIERIEEYLNRPPPPKPLLDGLEIMGIFSELEPKSGFIGHVKERLLEQQDALAITSKDQARDFVLGIKSEVTRRFKKA